MSGKSELKIEKRSEYLWITLPDAITMYDNKEIEQKIGQELRDRKDHVVLDFSNTGAVYSSGLGLMIRIRRFVTERGGVLSLVNVSEAIYEMFTALNIDKVFNIYATDVEFEISQDNFLSKNNGKDDLGMLFVAKKEENSCSINISGELTKEYDLTACREFTPFDDISLYLFDLSGLETVDSDGAEALLHLTKTIADGGGVCRAHGAKELKKEMLTILGADTYLSYFKDERSAFEGENPEA
jgi:anti-sigma B factor antagonist